MRRVGSAVLVDTNDIDGLGATSGRLVQRHQEAVLVGVPDGPKDRAVEVQLDVIANEADGRDFTADEQSPGGLNTGRFAEHGVIFSPGRGIMTGSVGEGAIEPIKHVLQ